jgi:hypothetical protein
MRADLPAKGYAKHPHQAGESTGQVRFIENDNNEMRESAGEEKELPKEQEDEQATNRSVISGSILLEADRIVPAEVYNGGQDGIPAHLYHDVAEKIR